MQVKFIYLKKIVDENEGFLLALYRTWCKISCYNVRLYNNIRKKIVTINVIYGL